MCHSCGKKLDKYMQANDALKHIDILLLKEQVFNHELLNVEITSLRYAKFLLLYILTKLVVPCNFKRQILKDLFYILFLKVSLARIRFFNLSFAIFFSSFFSYFKIVFMFLNYEHAAYDRILEFLDFCSNVCAIKSLEKNYFTIFSGFILSKMLALALLEYKEINI